MHYEIVRGAVPVDTLLIHGNIASNLWWEPAIESWSRLRAREDHRGAPWSGNLILAEWRGCGKSSSPLSEKDMDFSVLSRDYLDLLDSLGIQKANLIGHATGGMIALFAMMQDPSRFSRAVLLNPIPAQGFEVAPEKQASYLQMSRDRGQVKAIFDRMIHQNDPTTPFFERVLDQACATHALVWAHILQKAAGVDVAKDLAGLSHPTWVLHGIEDPILSEAGSRELAELLPEGRFEALEHQGHSCHVENPDRFVAMAHRFLFG